MFPSIGYITPKSFINFDSNGKSKSERLNLVNYFKNTFDLSNDLVIIINGWDSVNLSGIYEKIEDQKPKKLIFFIYDILRIYADGYETNIRNGALIENNLKDVRSPELDTIQSITNDFNIPFKVYHCEANCKIFENIYKFPIHYFDIFLASFIESANKSNIKVNYKTKKNYKFSSFSARFEPHKYLITSYLLSLENSLCSQLQKVNNKNLCKVLSLDNLSLNSEKMNTIYDYNSKAQKKRHAVRTTFKPYSIDKDFEYKNVSPKEQNNNIQEISRSFVHIVNESRFTVPMANISEKTIKPILAGRPFIIASGPCSLQLLKNLGFKTFSDFWDESYDLETDHSKRLQKIIDLIDNLNKLNNKQLKKMNKRMSSIFNHNLNNLKDVTRKSFEQFDNSYKLH